MLARLDFNIGFEMMIAYLFQTDCGGRAAKNRKFLSQLAFFHGNLIRSSEASAGDHPWPERSVRSDSLEPLRCCRVRRLVHLLYRHWEDAGHRRDDDLVVEDEELHVSAGTTC